MTYLVWAIGLIMVIEGVFFIIKPQMFKKLISWILPKHYLIKIGALSKLALGVLFLVFARSCRKPVIIIAFGLLICIAQISFLILETEKTTKFLNKFAEQSDFVYRFFAVVIIVLGVLLLYAGTPATN